MKLFSFKSLCLRWRGELIDNANVPVGLGEEGGRRERWGRNGEGETLFKCSNSHFKYHMERISMYIGWESFISMSGGEFLQILKGRNVWGKTCLTHTPTHTHLHTCTHAYAIGKARVSGESQGRLRLRALIDCSYGVYVPRPHLGVCQRVCCGPAGWKWQHREWFCHPSLKRKVRCAMLVIHQDIDSSDGI